jgi:hypothetical protein
MQHNRQTLWNAVAAVLANAAAEKLLACRHPEEGEYRPNAAQVSLESGGLEAYSAQLAPQRQRYSAFAFQVDSDVGEGMYVHLVF